MMSGENAQTANGTYQTQPLGLFGLDWHCNYYCSSSGILVFVRECHVSHFNRLSERMGVFYLQ